VTVGLGDYKLEIRNFVISFNVKFKLVPTRKLHRSKMLCSRKSRNVEVSYCSKVLYSGMLRNPGFSAWSESILSSTPLQCQPYSASKKTTAIPTLQCFKKPFEKTSFHIYTGLRGCLELRLEGYEFVLLQVVENEITKSCE
jgi:hypothetical protein